MTKIGHYHGIREKRSRERNIREESKMEQELRSLERKEQMLFAKCSRLTKGNETCAEIVRVAKRSVFTA